MKLAIAAAFAALTLAGSALADSRITATLEAPAATPAKFIAAHAVWNCAGTTCVASIAPDGAGGVNACQDLAKKVGRVTAYATERKALDAAHLARCNASATPRATVSAAR